jgi:outer membrane protein assembly factor BamB
LCITGLDGTTLVLEKSKALKIRANNELDDSFAASPTVVGNELFLRGRSHLCGIAGAD